jgi:hypothetical protein
VRARLPVKADRGRLVTVASAAIPVRFRFVHAALVYGLMARPISGKHARQWFVLFSVLALTATITGAVGGDNALPWFSIAFTPTLLAVAPLLGRLGVAEQAG